MWQIILIGNIWRMLNKILQRKIALSYCMVLPEHLLGVFFLATLAIRVTGVPDNVGWRALSPPTCSFQSRTARLCLRLYELFGILENCRRPQERGQKLLRNRILNQQRTGNTSCCLAGRVLHAVSVTATEVVHAVQQRRLQFRCAASACRHREVGMVSD